MSKRTALYRVFGDQRRLLYVGISCRALARMAQHQDDKNWWTDVRTIEVAWFASEPAALAAERDAIASERPAHNLVAGHQSPGDGSTPNRIVRLGSEWEELGAVVGMRRRAETIRSLVRWYLSYPGAELPDGAPCD